MNLPSDSELVETCRTELPYRTQAFEILVERYKQKVFGKTFSIVKNREEAEDLSQDIFVKVFHGLPGFRSNATFSTWLYAITVNTCLNHLETRQRRPWRWVAEDVEEVKAEDLHDTELFFTVRSGLEQEQLQKQIDRIMDSLGAKDREILELRYLQELDYQTIATRIGIGLSATKMRLKRARETFKIQHETQFKGTSQ